MCEHTERAAVQVLKTHLRDWQNRELNPHTFDEEAALVYLVQAGIRPSSLSCDLDWLIARAFKALMRGRDE